MRYVILVFSLLIAGSCSKPGNVTPSDTIVGTWRLTAYCKPASSSACTAVKVPSGKSVFVAFGKDGKFNETYENTKPIEYSFLGCGSGDYTIEGNNIRIVALCMSSTSGRLMQLVSVNNKQLILNPFGSGEYTFERE
ncbi:lipocalin family protein [Spirosoma sp.]|uniref:lipocalin family protein n=1 Tax=Spirosoma sp. TaxID=1899569 RepID=UPI003B3A46DD